MTSDVEQYVTATQAAQQLRIRVLLALRYGPGALAGSGSYRHPHAGLLRELPEKPQLNECPEAGVATRRNRPGPRRWSAAVSFWGAVATGRPSLPESVG